MDRIIEKKGLKPKNIAYLSGGGLLLAFVLYSLLLGDNSMKLKVAAERLSIATVAQGPFQEFIPVTGAVVPLKTIYLDAVEGGRVERRHMEAGTYVEAGDTILALSNTNLLLDIMYREAELVQQSNNLRNTQLAMEQNRLTLKSQLLELDYQIQRTGRIHDRNAELLTKQLISNREYDETDDEYQYLLKRRALTLLSHVQDSLFRETQITQLEAALRRMQDNLGIVRKNLENLVIRAPVSGQLTSLNAEVGESKMRGERLGQIDILSGFKVRANIDEHYIARVVTGQAASVRVGPDEYRLEVGRIFPEVLNGQFQVDLMFPGEIPAGIRRGQTLRLRLELGHQAEALLLARGGFFQTTGGRWVYVLDESGTFAVRRDIRLGRQNRDEFEVLQGLAAGDRVIVSSYENYGEYDKLILND